MAYKPPSIPNHPLLPKQLTKEELYDRSTKGLCWHCDEPWSHNHRCKKRHLLLIEPIKDMEEETMKVGGLLKQQPITVLIDTENTIMNSKVAVWMALPIKDCSRFDVKFADGRILKCDRRCPWVKLLLQDQEIIVDFFLLPLDDYEAVLGIEWLMTLGDVS
ncbi:hypothetical protein B296_00012561 [Ensete ventricosum]|uniref:Uncharacterized protein n=1 Tax=Ensete ventricosum TaxID=4639 RepID=A0A426XIH0_ENSVE|nr:hypothetical protein B296_00012561 [Ensete ventricosum]